MADSEERHLKFVYRATLVVSALVLHIGMLATLGKLDHLLFGGGRACREIAPALFVMVIIGAHLIARAWCRRLGISRDTYEVLLIERGTETQEPETPTSAELRHHESQWLALGALCALCALLAVFTVVKGSPDPDEEASGYLLLVGCVAATMACSAAYFRKVGFVASVSEFGVIGQHRAGFRSRSIAWERIERCEVTAVRNYLGALSYPEFVLRDAAGNVLLLLRPFVGLDQTERFKAVIERYLATPGEPRA